MTVRTTIEAKAWTDIRFATLARLLALADADHAIIRTARLWSWQTEHYTPEAPTYVVDIDTIESTLGVVGAAGALVRARLAEETPDGYRICGAVGRIEWLWKKQQSSILGGEATKSKYANRSRPIGLPPGQSSGCQPARRSPPMVSRIAKQGRSARHTASRSAGPLLSFPEKKSLPRARSHRARIRRPWRPCHRRPRRRSYRARSRARRLAAG